MEYCVLQCKALDLNFNFQCGEWTGSDYSGDCFSFTEISVSKAAGTSVD